MRKFFKWLGIIVLSLALIMVIVVIIMVNRYKSMAKVSYEVSPAPIEIPTDSGSLARGAVLGNAICTGCHGGDFAGTEFFNVPALGVVPAPNITKGGRTKDYSDMDYIKAIRFGVKPDGHGLFVMPVEDFNYMSDADLGCLIAYLKSIPVNNKTWPDRKFTLMAQVIAGAGGFGHLYNVELLDLKDVKPKTAPEPGTDIAFGEYTMRIHGCWTCHGEHLNGNKSPDPSSPPGANLTVKGNFGNWSLAQFSETLHTGVTPEGKKLDTKYMPWQGTAQMTDLEIESIFNYIKSIPPMEDNEDLADYKAKQAK